MIPARKVVDVAVLGGGPAGAAAALSLTQRGRSVLIAERSSYRRPRVGESFPPAIQAPLAALGLWREFESAGYLPSVGVRSFWGRPRQNERSFLFDPYNVGWHVDRAAFDSWLARKAESRGAELLLGHHLRRCERLAGDGWTLDLTGESGIRRVQASFVVDASGCAAVLTRKLGRRRIRHDRMVGIAGCFLANADAEEVEACVLIEAVRDGWWYSAPLPSDRLIAVLMTDADLCARHSLFTRRGWEARIRQAPHTLERTSGRVLTGDPKVFVCRTAHTERPWGRAWLAAGDAAFSFDPLSGDGVHRALQQGIEAAESIERSSLGDERALEVYGEKLTRTLGSYLETQRMYYSRETRWPEAPFWMRRQSKPPSPVERAVQATRIDG